MGGKSDSGGTTPAQRAEMARARRAQQASQEQAGRAQQQGDRARGAGSAAMRARSRGMLMGDLGRTLSRVLGG